MKTRTDSDRVYGPICLANAFGARLGALFLIADLSLNYHDASAMSVETALLIQELRDDFAELQAAIDEVERARTACGMCGQTGGCDADCRAGGR